MYVELVNQCLNAEPSKRPSLEDLTEKLRNWLNGGTVIKEFDDIQINTEPLKQYHSGAIYIRRKFPNHPEHYIHTFNNSIVTGNISKTSPEHYTHTFNNSIVTGKISKGHWKQKLTTLSNSLYAKLKSSKISNLGENSAKNKDICNFIEEIHLEWIPFSSFGKMKKIGNGGFATVYCAIWKSTKVALKQMHIPEDAINKMINEFAEGTPKCYAELAKRCMDADINKRPKIREINELLDHWNLILNYGPKYPEYKPGGYASLYDRFDYYNNERDFHYARLDAIEERRIVENKSSDYGPEFKNYRIPDLFGDKNSGRNYYSYFDSIEKRKQIQNEFIESDKINKSENNRMQIYENSLCTKWNFKQSIGQILENLSDSDKANHSCLINMWSRDSYSKFSS
ncbi:serine/threonine protein kinase [Gigaspora margarita]|uniref:Serine/threonine protein kinase n=1 Tax=Gigaspora margarita TaxID=4874 RepID=A0A8H4B0F2_GIGMA|nr:serine/threonine protein kinase [Gigaspora margarita]